MGGGGLTIMDLAVALVHGEMEERGESHNEDKDGNIRRGAISAGACHASPGEFTRYPEVLSTTGDYSRYNISAS